MIYTDLYKSLQKLCTDFITNNPGDALTYFNFDTAGSIADYPTGDVIGLGGYQLTEDEKMYEIDCMIGISTVNDTNHFKLLDLTDKVWELVRPEKLITIYDAGGVPKGLFKVMNGTRTLPVARSNGRVVQFVVFSAGADVTRISH